MKKITPQELEALSSLTQKLAFVMSKAAQEPGALTMRHLRHWLGQTGILLMPDVKTHHEVELPGQVCAQTGLPLVRTTVVLEVKLLNAQTDESLASRWIGQAVDHPGVSAERAIASALEDFLRKTFLDFELTSHHIQPEVRRQPQGAPASSPKAFVPPEPVNDDVDRTQLDLPVASKTSLEEEPQEAQPAKSQEVPDPAPEPPTPAWKAANALWRALVSEVVTPEVMNEYEQSLESQHKVKSWREITAQEIRTVCHGLRKRSAMPSDVRKIGEREEFILAQISKIPKGSSLTRVEHELERLVTAVETQETWEKFIALYLKKMNAQTLSDISGRALVALCRKLRRLPATERATFIQDALGRDNSTPPPQEDNAA